MLEERKINPTNLRFVVLILFIIAIILIFRFTPIRGYINRTKLQEFIQSFGFWAPLVYIIIHIVGPTLMIPRIILSITGGLVFGLLWGMIYSFFGSTIGGCVAFGVARIMGRGFIEKLTRRKLKRLNDIMAEIDLKTILFLRLVPLAFNYTSYTAGLSRIRFMDYLIGTLIGTIPVTFVYVYLGSSLTDIQSLKFFRIVSLVLIIVVVIVVRRRRKKLDNV